MLSQVERSAIFSAVASLVKKHGSESIEAALLRIGELQIEVKALRSELDKLKQQQSATSKHCAALERKLSETVMK